MSRRRRRRSETYQRRSEPTKRATSLLDTYRYTSSIPTRSQMRRIEALTPTQRRDYYKPKVQQSPLLRRTPTKRRKSTLRRLNFNPIQSFQIGNLNPVKSVLVCAKREIRKQVMHAFQKTGSGGGSFKPKTITQDSLIKCVKRRRR